MLLLGLPVPVQHLGGLACSADACNAYQLLNITQVIAVTPGWIQTGKEREIRRTSLVLPVLVQHLGGLFSQDLCIKW